eukprot:659029-Alexandrium_andersonii.AAC.1
MTRASHVLTPAPGRTRMSTAQEGQDARRGHSIVTPPQGRSWPRSWWKQPAQRKSGSCSPGKFG